MSKVSQHSSNKSVNSVEKLEPEMLGSKIDQLPVQTVSPKVEVELTSYYQSRKGHICNLTKYISRLSVMIDRTEPLSSVKEIQEKVEYTLFKNNQLTEQICLLLIDNESEMQKAQELCTEHMSNKALNESHVYTQNQLEKLHFTYERLILNDPFQQMNEPYLHNLAPPVRSVPSKGSQSSKSNSGSSNANRKGLVKAELLADQEKIKAERKLEKLKLQEKQFRLQQELERAEILENLEEAENKLKLAKILDDLDSVEQSNNSSIDEHQINSKPKIDSNHKQNLLNQNPSPLLYKPQKTIFNLISEIKNHTIQHNIQTDPPHTKACISPTLETKNPELLRKSTYYSVDEFIDELIEGQETIISSEVC